MPTTPDVPAPGAGRSADPEADASAAGAEHHAARETVPIDVRPRRPASDFAGTGDAGSGDSRPTVALAPGRRAGTTVDKAPLPTQRGRTSAPRRAPLLVAVAFATLWAALLSYLPVASVMWLARTLEGAGGAAGALSAGLAAWLLGHGVPLDTAIGPVGLAPLLLTLLAGWRLNRAGIHVTRAIGARRGGSLPTAARVAVAVGTCYGLLGALAAVVVDAPGLSVSVPQAGLTFAMFGFVGAGFGALRCTDASSRLIGRAPAGVRHGLRAGIVAALLVLAAGAGFTGLSVATGGGQAAEIIGAFRTGVAGQAGITLVSLAYGVNAAIWGAAYLLGPGFLLGTGSTVRLTEVTVGPLPTLPLLAGLPDGPVGAAGAALLAVPVLAGMAAGWLLARGLARGTTPGWSTVLGAAALAGPVAGLLLGALAWLSSGSLGADRLARIGPVPWQVALVAAAVIAVSTTLGAAAARGLRAQPRP